LGEWAGLCKYDKEGAARKVIKCSCCVIKEWGVRTDSHAILEQHLKQ
jgi:small subunit ribosomal protein S12e